jgi:signal transduction histidine kinase
MQRPWLVVVAFLSCLAVVLAAMGWLTVTVLRLDRAEEQSRRQAETQENKRLALWRMESLLAPLVAQENARPYSAYRAYFPVQCAYNTLLEEMPKGTVFVPSPLIQGTGSEHILVHFQYEPDGKLSSPQVDGTQVKDVHFKPGYGVVLASFGKDFSRDRLVTTLNTPDVTAQADVQVQTIPRGKARDTWQGQESIGNNEFNMRSRAAKNYANANSQVKQKQQIEQTSNMAGKPQQLDQNEEQESLDRAGERIVEGPFKALWIDQKLILARGVAVNDKIYVQGCLLNWDTIGAWLTNEIRDLIPDAQLLPVKDSDPKTADMLATLPLKLQAPETPLVSSNGISPLRAALLVAWACAGLAAIAVAVLLSGVLVLSERRAAFVSAVTHELRTPLTTFRLYTQMLSEGMVSTEEKRAQYLDTLRVESDRLAHLVENVLAYSRLEKGRTGGRRAPVAARDLLARVQQRLAERATQAGKKLVIDPESVPADLVLDTDTSAVEQILFNLVDNSCKYAATAADERIIVRGESNGALAQIYFRDYGPGIGPEQLRRLFRPFSKSASEAAVTAPGVGLGLSLSRRLAREMGGDLKLDTTVKDGAAFVLSLPRASA